MKKVWITILIIAILLIFGGLVGWYIYNINNVSGKNMVEAKELADDIQNTLNTPEENLVTTASVDNKTTPNGLIIEKIYYKSCKHRLEERKDITEKLVNKTKEEIAQIYNEWELEEYSPTQITVYQEKEGTCGKHYVLREHNGVIGIYKINENNEEQLKEDTQIQTKYLPETDLIHLKEGIKVIGDEELNTVLEDFE